MKKFLLIFVAVSAILVAQAQNAQVKELEFHPNFMVEVGFQMAFPTGEFADSLDNNGYGIGVDLAYQFKGTPIILGAEFGYTVFSSQTRNVPWSLTIPDVRVDVTTTNSYMFGTAFLRFQPDLKYVLPYFEGHIGFNYLETTTKVEDEDNYDDDDYEIASSTDFSDGGLLYGFGGGLEIPVFKYRPSEEQMQTGDMPVNMSIDLQVRYFIGDELEYLDEDSKEIVNGEVNYYPKKSQTNILAPRIGFTVKF
jgi:hypothetical protein